MAVSKHTRKGHVRKHCHHSTSKLRRGDQRTFVRVK